jgi:hypothetical protein
VKVQDLHGNRGDPTSLLGRDRIRFFKPNPAPGGFSKPTGNPSPGRVTVVGLRLALVAEAQSGQHTSVKDAVEGIL